MSYKWIGAIFIVVSCGGAGFSLAAGLKREENILAEMISAIVFMKSQLEFRLTPLPQLCRQTGKQATGQVRQLFMSLARELEQQLFPEASDCIYAVLADHRDLPPSSRIVWTKLGKSLGQMDLSGQLRDLEQLIVHCRQIQGQMSNNRDQRLRSYQTLSLCAGVAMAILLF